MHILRSKTDKHIVQVMKNLSNADRRFVVSN